MLQRPIPSSGELLPVVGLGTWLQFDVGESDFERKPLREVLGLMAGGGARLLDTSPMYGRAEDVLGQLASEPELADKFFFATKVWTTGKQAGIDQMEASMLKLRRKSVDLMQIHNLVDWQTHLKTLRAWKSEGRIRYLGITHYTVESHAQLEDIIRAEPIDFVQCNYSIRVRHADKSLLDLARASGVAVIVNEPFEKGALFRAVRGMALPDWAAEYEIRTWGQFFLKFILSHPAVTCVIPGTSDPKHLADNLLAGQGPMPDAKARARMADFMDKL